MTKFRLKMDMSEFYDDERNLVYILVDPNWEYVHCLQEHVQKVFDVPDVHFLTEDGVYIPPRESIDIIQKNDVLCAIIPQKMKKKRKNIAYNDEAEESMEGDTRKCSENGLTSSTPHERPRKKRRLTVNIKNLKHIIDVGEAEAQKVQTNVDTTTKSKKADYTASGYDSSEKEAQDVSVASQEENDETVRARKRKRNRKKNKADKKSDSPRLSSVPVPISSSTLRTTRSTRTPNIHIFYNEISTPIEGDSTKRKKRVIYKCHLTMEGDLEPRQIELREIGKEAPPAKAPKVIIQEDLVLVRGSNDTTGSDEQNETSVIEVDDTVVPPEPEEGSTDPHPTINVEEVLPLSEPLLDLPMYGDIILFRMHRLIDGTTPEVTEYICCRCEQVDSNLRTLTLLVLDGHDQTAEIPRISMGDGDRIVPNENTNCIMVFFDEVLDKKIFRMSQ